MSSGRECACSMRDFEAAPPAPYSSMSVATYRSIPRVYVVNDGLLDRLRGRKSSVKSTGSSWSGCGHLEKRQQSQTQATATQLELDARAQAIVIWPQSSWARLRICLQVDARDFSCFRGLARGPWWSASSKHATGGRCSGTSGPWSTRCCCWRSTPLSSTTSFKPRIGGGRSLCPVPDDRAVSVGLGFYGVPAGGHPVSSDRQLGV